MSPFIGELLGTTILMLLGCGVNANVSLKATTGNNAGWIVITLGWGMAVFTAVFMVASSSGAHINPAVTIGLAAAGKFPWGEVPMYLAAQMIGAILGAILVWLQYRPHFEVTEDPGKILGTFSTSPAIPNTVFNLISEAIGTFVLVLAVLYITSPTFGNTEGSLGSLDALPVALVVLGIGLCLGGPTGYAINPARDLGPRIAHAFLPISKKGDSNWGYAWIPVVGPILGGLLAAIIYLAIG
ncbi:MAG: MIP/aquaporin family protein [Bacteroidota bacterium]